MTDGKNIPSASVTYARSHSVQVTVLLNVRSGKSQRIDSSTGEVKIERRDGASIASLDSGEVLQTIEAMQGSDRNRPIAIDRWKRSQTLDGTT